MGRDADVVLEVINGITFLTPLWLRKPRVAMVHHVHRDLYIGEFGALARPLLRVAPRDPAPAPSLPPRALPDDLDVPPATTWCAVGIPHENITVEYLGVDPESFQSRRRARAEPRLLFVGRLKAYKRIELVLDVLEAMPEATLDIVGDGDHREALEAEIERRGLTSRVRDARLRGRRRRRPSSTAAPGWP